MVLITKFTIIFAFFVFIPPILKKLHQKILSRIRESHKKIGLSPKGNPSVKVAQPFWALPVPYIMLELQSGVCFPKRTGPKLTSNILRSFNFVCFLKAFGFEAHLITSSASSILPMISLAQLIIILMTMKIIVILLEAIHLLRNRR